MARFFHPLLTLLANATESQLAQYVEVLKAENRILRSKLYIAGITANPDDAWMAQQARNLCMVSDDWADKPKHIVCDRDTKFTAQFEELLKQDGLQAPEAKKAAC
jgi:hypothetical protein